MAATAAVGGVCKTSHRGLVAAENINMHEKNVDQAQLVSSEIFAQEFSLLGIEYNADPRQAEKLIRDTQLQGVNAVTPPGTKPLPHQLEQEQPLSMSDFTRFRGQAARADYLGPDRPDII